MREVETDGVIEVWVPRPSRDGFYTLAYPRAKQDRNLESNEVVVTTLTEVAKLAEQGYSCRMWPGYGAASLIGSKSIRVVWPEPPQA